MQEKISEKDAKTPIANYQAENGQDWLSEYVAAIKDGFIRVWHWKYLWFWGLLLPAGGFGSGFGSGFNEKDIESDASSGVIKSDAINYDELQDWLVSFWQQNHNQIILYTTITIIIVLSLVLIFWIFGAIARSGIIKALSEIQEQGQPKVFKSAGIWRQGKANIGKLMFLDIIIFLVICVFVLALISLFLIFGLFGSFILPLGFCLLLLGVVFIFVVSYVNHMATVQIALTNQSAIAAIKSSLKLFGLKFKEVLKLFFVELIRGLLAGVIFFILTFTLVFSEILLVIPLGYWIYAIYQNEQSFSSLMFLPGILIVLLILFFIFCIMLLRSFYSVWKWDTMVWWMKRNSGIKFKSKATFEALAREIQGIEAEKVVVDGKLSSGAVLSERGKIN